MSTRIDEVADSFNFGTPSAVKRGHTSEFPYVAIITGYMGQENTTHNPMGKRAYATRQEAIEAATRYIALLRAKLRTELAMPHMRALRQQHGLPRDITNV